MEFKKEYDFLSNFYPCEFEFEGIIYSSVENAFQAAKTLNHNERLVISKVTPAEAKKQGRYVKLRSDWEYVKENIMFDLVMRKFKDPLLQKKLLNTGDIEIIEHNWWHDNEYGKCLCSRCKNRKYKNKLGKYINESKRSFRRRIESVFYCERRRRND